MLGTLRHFAPAVLAASLTAGCTTAAVVVVDREPAILVEPETHVLMLQSSGESRRLAGFLWAASQGRLDAVHVTVVGPYAGLRHAVIRSVRAVGVEPRKIREAHGPAGSGGAVRVVAVRYHARPPVCPPLLATGPSFNENDVEPTLGCADLANLALQVNDPKDLLVNAAVPPGDGERAAIPVTRYRLFGSGPGGGTSGGASASAGSGTTTSR
jgi:pilus assembly protein CpaD